jgi:hypothetical protein
MKENSFVEDIYVKKKQLSAQHEEDGKKEWQSWHFFAVRISSKS